MKTIFYSVEIYIEFIYISLYCYTNFYFFRLRGKINFPECWYLLYIINIFTFWCQCVKLSVNRKIIIIKNNQDFFFSEINSANGSAHFFDVFLLNRSSFQFKFQSNSICCCPFQFKFTLVDLKRAINSILNRLILLTSERVGLDVSVNQFSIS